MGKLTLTAFILLTCISCRQKQTLTEQLSLSFSHHLEQIDAAAKLDSVHILWNIPFNQRLARIIDDSIYVREYSRIKSQLAIAKQQNEKDSIAFYQYEINYMEQEIDSISRSIGQGDTAHAFGYLIGCAYYIKKKDMIRADSTILFVDSTHTIRFTEYMDSSLRRTVKGV